MLEVVHAALLTLMASLVIKTRLHDTLLRPRRLPPDQVFHEGVSHLTLADLAAVSLTLSTLDGSDHCGLYCAPCSDLYARLPSSEPS
jgi:hypothetical protein